MPRSEKRIKHTHTHKCLLYVETKGRLKVGKNTVKYHNKCQFLSQKKFKLHYADRVDFKAVTKPEIEWDKHTKIDISLKLIFKMGIMTNIKCSCFFLLDFICLISPNCGLFNHEGMGFGYESWVIDFFVRISGETAKGLSTSIVMTTLVTV